MGGDSMCGGRKDGEGGEEYDAISRERKNQSERGHFNSPNHVGLCDIVLSVRVD